VAWSKAFFDQTFEADLVTLRTALRRLIAATKAMDNRPYSFAEAADIYLVALGAPLDEAHEDFSVVFDQLRLLSGGDSVFADWAVSTFNRFFYSDLKELMAPHPSPATDDRSSSSADDGDSKKIVPVHVERFNSSDPLHLLFAGHAAKILSTSYGREGELALITRLLANHSICSDVSDRSSSPVESLISWMELVAGEGGSGCVAPQLLLEVLSRSLDNVRPVSFEKVMILVQFIAVVLVMTVVTTMVWYDRRIAPV
jgi:hypothetical protein